MRQRLISPRIVIGCILLIFVFTFTRFYRGRYDEPASFSTESHIIHHKACRIWPEWNASDRENLRYDDCNTKEAQLPSVGDAKVFGNPDRCLKAKSRLDVYRMSSTKDYNGNAVQWGNVQKRCAADNQHLYLDEISTDSTRNYDLWRQPPSPAQTDLQTWQKGGRTAVVLRTWDNYEYNDARRAWLRALITETALHSGGHYEVFLMVNVKDNTTELEEDQAAYRQALEEYVPEEFRDMAVLWNERTVEKWYPKVEEYRAQNQMYQALQIFSHQFPHFTHFWQLEMDLRFTGHIYDSLHNAVAFAESQPRRNLWERNGRFYIPELHGSYDDFTKAVDDEIGDSGVWGPIVTTDFMPKGPKPPPRSEKDWGIHEDADVVGLFPAIDPIGTDWIYESMIHGFADGLATPRRAAFVSITRSSRRLLQLISEAQRETGQWIASEATLETYALLHGMKAVTIPHQIMFANDWTAQQLAENINRGPKHTKAGGHAISSSYTSQGWVDGPWPQSSYWFAPDDADNQWRKYLGGDCMPPLLLHPVKEE